MPLLEGFEEIERNNHLILEKLTYNKIAMKAKHENLLLSMVDEQRGVHNKVINAISLNEKGLFFVYGYGGTRKTFLWKTLSVG